MVQAMWDDYQQIYAERGIGNSAEDLSDSNHELEDMLQFLIKESFTIPFASFTRDQKSHVKCKLTTVQFGSVFP